MNEKTQNIKENNLQREKRETNNQPKIRTGQNNKKKPATYKQKPLLSLFYLRSQNITQTTLSSQDIGLN